jgi:hypothetical protein
VWLALAVSAMVVSAASASDWTAPITVADVPSRSRPSFLTLHVGPTGVPVASWEERHGRGIRWARRTASGWSARIRVPGFEIGGLYGVDREWTTNSDGFETVRRGAAGHRFGSREKVGRNDSAWVDWQSATAPDGASIMVLLYAPGGRESQLHRGQIAVATRLAGEPFRFARVLWHAPLSSGAFGVSINDRGDGLVAWASPWSILGVSVRNGHIGPVRRLAASGGRVAWLDTDVTRDGSGIIGWLVTGSGHAVHALALAPSRRGNALGVLHAVSRPFAADISGQLAALGGFNGGLIVWQAPTRLPDTARVWAMPVRHGNFGRRQPLSPPHRNSEWVTAQATNRGGVAILWTERDQSAAARQRRSILYAAERYGAHWIHKRELVSDTAPLADDEADIAFNPCTGRLTALWLVPPASGRERIVSATGPRVGRPSVPCR